VFYLRPVSEQFELIKFDSLFKHLKHTCTTEQGELEVERANVIKEEIVEKERRFLAVYVEAKNSCLILLSENEDKLGTLAIAVPKTNESLGLMASSSVLVGNKNEISARMFSEYVASKKGKIAMVSVYLDKLSEMDAQIYFKRLLEKVLETKKEEEAEKA
jgi:hypothetical protein